MDSIGSALAELSTDVNCRRCGYNLRGLLPTGKCPECGTPIVFSVREFRLRYANPQWVSRLRLAAKMPEIGLLAACLCVALTVFILVPLGQRIGFSTTTPETGLFITIGIAITCLLYGAWAVTTPCMAMVDYEPDAKARKTSRICLVLAFAGMILALSLYFLQAGIWVWLVAFTISPIGIVGVIGAWAHSRYIQSLSWLMASDFVLRKARNYWIGYVASWSAFCIGAVMSLTPAALFGCLIFPGTIGTIAYGALLLYSPRYLLQAIEEEFRLAGILDAEQPTAQSDDIPQE